MKEDYDRDQAQEPGNPAAHRVLALLRSLEEGELRSLLACQVADRIRLRLRPQVIGAGIARRGSPRPDLSDARQVVFAVQEEAAGLGREAIRLADHIEAGEIAAAFQSLSRSAPTALAPDAEVVATRIRSWYERSDCYMRRPSMRSVQANPISPGAS